MAYQEFKLQVLTREKGCFVEITAEVNRILRERRWTKGLLNLLATHTTCGLTLNEHADPAVVKDLLGRLEEMIPTSRGADQHAEGNSAAHLKASFFGASLTLPVSNNSLELGTWAGVFVTEFDGPRTRTILLSFLH
ncbi:MAG: hypothetical protein A2600_06890 [Candidatus Lambdaproteobacteria bacterium RIFOXYD1_FULL_56_27]|uniref:Secondary thiamine-phosphate synthase enzyme n=1 Tax=Candidatus Lambdaproteobacteria bacterium RIFOXYD2_FULL_56_26 TaxID=1817773 RepID=A0A1F6GPX8_9PROT|nr:MAG: hypothetical protein A2557_05550 [Candidatus Lambdaproteobacteria bacterium RIFOXYD2_FULL_56_26]OGH03660.1 MAG: hypothetical protein A2426_00340 [Candidatus Lambdaproteobacteria bacterium RIFOXYC1_FULL_56_13]OGH07244.1 MAG: hypothetical protein A2600_06890 [Candidatus Lambdaproteobacteria bacterium RIFOXYD1_FULL_56_27]